MNKPNNRHKHHKNNHTNNNPPLSDTTALNFKNSAPFDVAQFITRIEKSGLFQRKGYVSVSDDNAEEQFTYAKGEEDIVIMHNPTAHSVQVKAAQTILADLDALYHNKPLSEKANLPVVAQQKLPQKGIEKLPEQQRGKTLEVRRERPLQKRDKRELQEKQSTLPTQEMPLLLDEPKKLKISDKLAKQLAKSAKAAKYKNYSHDACSLEQRDGRIKQEDKVTKGGHTNPKQTIRPNNASKENNTNKPNNSNKANDVNKPHDVAKQQNQGRIEKQQQNKKVAHAQTTQELSQNSLMQPTQDVLQPQNHTTQVHSYNQNQKPAFAIPKGERLLVEEKSVDVTLDVATGQSVTKLDTSKSITPITKKSYANKENKQADAKLKKMLLHGYDFLSEQSKIDLSIGLTDINNNKTRLSDYSVLLVPPFRGLERLIFDLQAAQGITVKMIGQAFEKNDAGEYLLKSGYRKKIDSVIYNEVLSALYTHYFVQRHNCTHSDNTDALSSRAIDNLKEAQIKFNDLLNLIDYNCKKLKEIGFAIR